ncbi:MAG: hypothetical protein AAF730_14735 [Bacteroidota bacterium]
MTEAKRLKGLTGVALRVAHVAIFLVWVCAVFAVPLPFPLDVLAYWMLRGVEFLLLTPAVFVPLFVGMWLLIGRVFAKRSGWSRLARDYTLKETGRDITDVKLTPISGSAGGVSFARAYLIGATQEGLVLKAKLLFKSGHPALFIPWAVVHFVENDSSKQPSLVSRMLDRVFKTEYTTIQVTTHPEFDMQIRQSDFERTGVSMLIPGQ